MLLVAQGVKAGDGLVSIVSTCMDQERRNWRRRFRGCDGANLWSSRRRSHPCPETRPRAQPLVV